MARVRFGTEGVKRLIRLDINGCKKNRAKNILRRQTDKKKPVDCRCITCVLTIKSPQRVSKSKWHLNGSCSESI